MLFRKQVGLFILVMLSVSGMFVDAFAQNKFRVRKNICNMKDDASCISWVSSRDDVEPASSSLSITVPVGDPEAMDVAGGGVAEGTWVEGDALTFVVTNTGAAASGNISYVLDGDVGGHFVADVVLTTCSTSLDAAASCDIVLSPRADRDGSYSATLRVSSPDAGNATRALAGVASGFSGGGGLPVATLSISPVSAEGMDIDAAGSPLWLALYGDAVSFTVRNCDGCESTSDINVQLAGENFVVASNGCTAPLAGGASCVIAIEPTADADVAAYTGTLTVSADEGGAASASLAGSAGGFGYGDMYCWGHFSYGKLGHDLLDARTEPMAVAGMGYGVDLMAPGYDHTCALRDGAAYCWGRNHMGQLGDNSLVASTPPVEVVNMDSGVTDIKAGWSHTCAIKAGVLYCWGGNVNGVLGDGTGANSLVPVEVQGALAGGGVSFLSVGVVHSCAIKSGALYCWGDNSFGKLGDGTTTNRTAPVPVVNMESGVTSVMVGTQGTCAVRSGAAYCWGRGYGGALGNGSTMDSSVPVAVLNMGSGVTAVSTGLLRGCALKDGAVYCWGYNQPYGQVGDGTTINRTSPVPVVDMDSGVTALSSGDHHNCAIKSGALYCWGRNETTGALGQGDFVNSAVPVMVLRMDSGVAQIANGIWHTCAIKP